MRVGWGRGRDELMYRTMGTWSEHAVSSTQGVYNRLLLVPIVGGACFLRHQLAAVFTASFGVFRMMYEISRINRMGEEGDFCDVLPMYP